MIKIKIEGTGTGNLTAGHEIPKFPSRKIFDEYEINCQNQFLTIAKRPERKSVCEKICEDEEIKELCRQVIFLKNLAKADFATESDCNRQK